jgi:thiol-disulfide isomerase/thioredoxin
MATKTKIPGYVQQPKKKGLSTGALVGIVVGAVVALFVVIAIVANLGGDEGSASGGDLEQVRPVTWTGTALPKEPEDGGEDKAIGLEAPRLEGQSFDGSEVVIDPSDGRDKLLVFLAHWCNHCQAELPDLVAWKAAGKQPADLDMVAIATGTNPTFPNYPPSEWLDREGWTDPVLADGPTTENFEAGRAYGLSSYPYLVVVDQDGVVKARWSGEFPDEATFEAWLQGALAS